MTQAPSNNGIVTKTSQVRGGNHASESVYHRLWECLSVRGAVAGAELAMDRRKRGGSPRATRAIAGPGRGGDALAFGHRSGSHGRAQLGIGAAELGGLFAQRTVGGVAGPDPRLAAASAQRADAAASGRGHRSAFAA